MVLVVSSTNTGVKRVWLGKRLSTSEAFSNNARTTANVAALRSESTSGLIDIFRHLEPDQPGLSHVVFAFFEQIVKGHLDGIASRGHGDGRRITRRKPRCVPVEVSVIPIIA